ncbi:MAG: DUF5989 family protein [Planctomycetaceae bacterium]
MTQSSDLASKEEAKPAVDATSSFAEQADEASPGIVQEFIQFLGENKKWWLIPILVAVGLIATLVALSSSAIAPLIYPLF